MYFSHQCFIPSLYSTISSEISQFTQEITTEVAEEIFVFSWGIPAPCILGNVVVYCLSPSSQHLYSVTKPRDCSLGLMETLASRDEDETLVTTLAPDPLTVILCSKAKTKLHHSATHQPFHSCPWLSGWKGPTAYKGCGQLVSVSSTNFIAGCSPSPLSRQASVVLPSCWTRVSPIHHGLPCHQACAQTHPTSNPCTTHFVKYYTHFKATLKYHPYSESLCSLPGHN